MEEETTNNSNQQSDNKGFSQPSVSTIRTYKTDLIDVVQNEDQSLAQLVLKSQERKRREDYNKSLVDEYRETTKRTFYTSTLIVLLSITVITAAYIFVQKPGLSNLSEQILEAPIIADSYHNFNAKIILSNFLADDVAEYLKTAHIKRGSIQHFYLTTDIIQSAKSEMQTLDVKSFFELWSNNTPPLLIRSLSPESYMLGVHIRKSDGKPSRFMVFNTENYNNSFAGMLIWENNLLADIQELYSIEYSYGKDDFIDSVISNTEVRLLENINGEPLIIYAFTDKQTLVITDNEETFIEIVHRLEIPIPKID